ncbi:MAG TPA: hypothetical protein VIZ20_02590 [Streptosporangiaceae bacterium]|jgi:hypothetical protein
MDDHQDPRDPGQPREDVDGWLHARIDPLPPPPGTFDLIKRRVRRRRYRQVAMSAAVAAAVAGAVVVVPRVATSVLNVTQNNGSGAASAKSSAPNTHVSQGNTGSGAESTGTPTPVPTITPPAPVPQNFRPTSVTFVGLNTGWVIGQAGVNGKCFTQYCTSVARTSDAGKTWAGVPAPQTGYPNGASGVGQIRFLDENNGWAFGPQLYATTDGGKTWAEQDTGGKRVTALETVGDRAFAVFATCTGTGTEFAAQCTQFSLYSSPEGSSDWTPVTGAGNLSDGGQDSSASLVLTSTKGYLLAPDGSLYAGPVNGTGSWQQVSSRPAGAVTCSPGAAQADGQPSGAFLTTANNASAVLACTVPGGGANVFTSSDGGAAWQQAGTVSGGRVTTAATQEGGEIVLSTSDGIQVSDDNGQTFHLSASGSSGPPGGFGWVGMTSQTQGVALPADPFQHTAWFTFDGGQTWQPRAVSGP